MATKKVFKCPLCDFKSTNKPSLYRHIEDEHKEQYKNSKTESPAQFYFNLKYNKTSGKCIVCGSKTNWNPSVERYDRICGERCSEKYREMFKERMNKKYGKDHLLNDPDQQKKMLANRKISGEYKWSDGKSKKTYTGSYEKDFLEFLDIMMQFKSHDVIAPAPQVFKYQYEGKDRFYIPDFYIASLNLLVEIKDGGENPNQHHKIQDVDKKKELLKDNVMKNQKEYNYLKITDKDYSIFMNYLIDIKTGEEKWIPPKDDNKVNVFQEEVSLEDQISAIQIEDNIKSFFNEMMDEFKLLEDYNNEEMLSEGEEKKRPVFIMVSTPGIHSPFSSVIRQLTHCKYSHCSISFDRNLENFYSFTIEKGFTKEPKSKFIKLKYKFTILYTYVSESSYKKMKKFIDYMEKNKNKFHYNKDKMLSLLIQKKEELTDAYVCSQFVSKVLDIGKVKLVKDFSLYTPKSFLDEPSLNFLIDGEDISSPSVYNKTKKL